MRTVEALNQRLRVPRGRINVLPDRPNLIAIRHGRNRVERVVPRSLVGARRHRPTIALRIDGTARDIRDAGARPRVRAAHHEAETSAHQSDNRTTGTNHYEKPATTHTTPPRPHACTPATCNVASRCIAAGRLHPQSRLPVAVRLHYRAGRRRRQYASTSYWDRPTRTRGAASTSSGRHGTCPTLPQHLAHTR